MVPMKERQIRRRQALEAITISINEVKYFDREMDSTELCFIFEFDQAKVKDVLWGHPEKPLIKMSLWTESCACYYLSRALDGKTGQIEEINKERACVHEIIKFNSLVADVELDVRIELLEGQDQIFHTDVIGKLYTSKEYLEMIDVILKREKHLCQICGGELVLFTLFNRHNNNAHCYSTNSDHYIIICNNCRPQDINLHHEPH